MGALPGLQLLGLQLSSIVRRHPIALQLLLPLCRRRSLFLVPTVDLAQPQPAVRLQQSSP
jgi:hypothetical protein